MKQEDWSYDTISFAYEVFKASITDPENPHEDYVYKKTDPRMVKVIKREI